MAKLTDQQVRQIRSSKLPVKTLAEKLNISERTIRRIKSGETYRHIVAETLASAQNNGTDTAAPSPASTSEAAFERYGQKQLFAEGLHIMQAARNGLLNKAGVRVSTADASRYLNMLSILSRIHESARDDDYLELKQRVDQLERRY